MGNIHLSPVKIFKHNTHLLEREQAKQFPMKYTMRYYRRHSIQIPACPACPFFKPSTTTQGASQSRRRASKDSAITTTPTKTSSSIAVDYSEWDAAMNSLLEEEGKQQSIQPPLASSPRRVPSNNRRNDMMMRKSTGHRQRHSQLPPQTLSMNIPHQ